MSLRIEKAITRNLYALLGREASTLIVIGMIYGFPARIFNRGQIVSEYPT